MKLELRKSMDKNDSDTDSLADQLQDVQMHSEEEKEDIQLPLGLQHSASLKNRPNLLVSKSPQKAVFSPVQSQGNVTISSIAPSSISSTMSTLAEVDRCREVIFKALAYKKNGNKQQFYAEFKSQAFLNGSTPDRHLRLWVKAFIESFPQIIYEHQDSELVDLLLFNLPWLCHGKPAAGSSGQPGSFNLSQQSQCLFTFGPSVVHGRQFSKLYPRLCFAVFPLNVQYVHRVINHLFSHLGIFSCEKNVCIGNWQQKNQPGLSPLTVQQIFELKGPKLLDQKRGNSQMALEGLAQRCRSILKEQHCLLEDEKTFVKTLIQFHPSRASIAENIEIGQAHGQNAFVVEGDPISTKKCLMGLQNAYLQACHDYANAYLKDTQIMDIVNLMAKIAKRYPFSQAEIYKNLLKTFPHQASNFEHILVYQNVAYLLCEKLLKQSAKESESSRDSKQSQSVSGMFKQATKRQQPLKHALQFEQQLLGKVIDTIAKLDAEVKIRGRKGATFPSQNSSHPIQSQEDYENEVNLRFYSEKEIKINLMLHGLIEYLKTRFRLFSKMQGGENVDQSFVEPLLTIFEDRIFKQAKSNFVQYVALFVCGNVNNSQIGQTARSACKLFLEKVLSYLIRRAFPSQVSQIQDLASRMQAINYLGSILSQNIARVPDTVFIRCLLLLLDHQQLQQGEDEQSNSRVFHHSYIMNLAQIYASRPMLIKQHDQQTSAKILSQLFNKKNSSLEYASPAVLHQLMQSLLDHGEVNKKIQEAKKRLLQVINGQSEMLKGQKLVVYNKISRSQPFTAVFFPNIMKMFQELQKISVVPQVEDKKVKDLKQFEQKLFAEPSPNIIKAPAPLSLMRSNITEKIEQLEQKEKPNHNMLLMGGSVTNQFRRTDKFTTEAIVRGQRAISDDQQSIQSDQITICSPVDPNTPVTKKELNNIKTQQRRDIKRATLNLTNDLQEQNKKIEAKMNFRKPNTRQ